GRILRVRIFVSTATAATEIYTLSLHDALPISRLDAVLMKATSIQPTRLSCAPRNNMTKTGAVTPRVWVIKESMQRYFGCSQVLQDRKSTRLNSSHVKISYAVFCLKKKKKKTSR